MGWLTGRRLRTLVLACFFTILSVNSATSEDIKGDAELADKLDKLTDQLKGYEDEFDAIDEGFTDFKDELGELDDNLGEFKDDLGDIQDDLSGLDEDVSAISDDKTYVHSGTSGSTMKVFGRVHADYWGFPDVDPQLDTLEGGPDGPQDRLAFRRVRFGVVGKLPANMEYKIAMEFVGGNATEFRDAWLGWNEVPFFQTILVGNQKRPRGLDHLNSSRYNVFLERPFIIESLNQDARRLGIASYGFSENQTWNWRYGVFNQRLIQDEGNYTNDHLQPEYAGRLATTFWYDEVSGGRGYGHLAVSGTLANTDGLVGSDNGGTGPDQNEARFRHRPEARTATRWLDTGIIAGADNYQILAGEALLNFGSLQLVGEFQNLWLQRDNGNDMNFHGGYAQASYFLTGEHMPWNRKNGTLGRIKPFEDFFSVRKCDGGIGRGWGAWQVAARWSYADFNDQDIFGGVGESVTIGLNWYWSSQARMQFNYIMGEIDNNQVTRGVPLSGHYDIVGTRLMVDF